MNPNHALTTSLVVLVSHFTLSVATDRTVRQIPVQATGFPILSGRDITRLTCETDADCYDDLTCVESFLNLFPCSSSSDYCYCFERVPCKTDIECIHGEICHSFNGFCVDDFFLYPSTESFEFEAGSQNFESCSQSTECSGSRDCVIVEDGQIVPCTPFDKFCFCLQTDPKPFCETTTDCDDHETCQGFANIFVCRASSLDGVQLNFEKCQSIYDCIQPRACVTVDDFTQTCTAGRSCICYNSALQCTSKDMCSEGENCNQDISLCVGVYANSSTVPFSPHNTTPLLNSSQTADTASMSTTIPTNDCTSDEDCRGGDQCRVNENNVRTCQVVDEVESWVCISVLHLSHFHESDLVYSTHRQARVLCDSRNNCATAGHIVIYRRIPMMMSSYCSEVRCTEKTMEVNSPKYKSARKIRSNSENLMFTSFAARYNSIVEEKLLRIIIKMGL
eukprot:gb/GEZJ01002986.1/.p1 GENE.gb/GEZJ01002986.1/~~gb/GEZJ01002986.1/.p1  ORF type:complete len:448 (-),score=10.61 gb/GEZJ01002986.1/:956-2299(-)